MFTMKSLQARDFVCCFANKADVITLEARKLGFVDVTEDQRYVVKQFLKGSDLFLSLSTGSGKSLCYWLLPGLCDTLRGRSGSLVLVKHVEALQAEVLRHVCTIGKRRVYAVVLKKRIEYFPAQVEACSLWKHCVVVSWSQPRSGFDTPHIAVHPLQSSAIHSVSRAAKSEPGPGANFFLGPLA